MKAYKQCAETAVDAVKDIQDTELKHLAFSLILEDLMTGETPEPIKPDKKDGLKLVEST